MIARATLMLVLLIFLSAEHLLSGRRASRVHRPPTADATPASLSGADMLPRSFLGIKTYSGRWLWDSLESAPSDCGRRPKTADCPVT